MNYQFIWSYEGSVAKSVLSIQDACCGLAVAPKTKGKQWPILAIREITGNLDIRGNPIIKGDVVESDYYQPEFKEIAIIGYDNHSMSFCFNDKNGNLKGEQDAFKYGNLTVIGNIYENPELRELA